MRFLTYDELSSSMETDRTLLHLAAFGGVFPRRAIELWRRRAKTAADYVGLFAAEGDALLGQVFVLRIPYVFREQTDVITGIGAVATRPDQGRSGIARSLLIEVHRREREAGIRFSALWTNRTWGAHALYEKLGYRDVYSSPWVVHAGETSRGSAPRSRELRRARPADLAGIDRLHDRVATGRLGFCRRPAGFSRTAVLSGWIDPAKNLIVAGANRELLGYAHLDRSPQRVVCGELVASSTAVQRSLVGEVQRTARGLPFAFQHTVVTDAPELFHDSGYSKAPRSWYGLMGNALGREWAPQDAIRQFATDDRRFLCLAGDRF
ncbi:MAG: GNAT family N-acetyltransferase [Thermoplasmata archaeon]